MAEPLVSVVMPCRNAAGTLPMALASLLAQTYQNWECVVVDDDSTDNCRDVISQAADPRIRYIRLSSHRGRGAARQRALEEARGDLIAMLDADDWLYPEKLERQVHAMVTDPRPGVISTGMSIVNAQHEIVGVRLHAPRERPMEIRAPMKRLSVPPIAYGPSMIRREVATRARFDSSLICGEDADYLLKILFLCRFAVLPDITYAYTEYSSTTLTKTLDGLGCGRVMFRKYRDRFPVASRIQSGKLGAKAFIYRFVFAVSNGSAMIARRSQPPASTQIRAFLHARETVRGIVTRRFE